MKNKIRLYHGLILIALVFIHWYIIYQIPRVEYDYNYSLILYGAAFSVFVYVMLLRFWFINRTSWRKWIVEAVLYTIIASPVTFILVCLNIQELFGVHLKM